MARNVPLEDGTYPFTEREWQRLNEQDRVEKRKLWRLRAAVAVLFCILLVMAYLVYFLVFRSHDYALPLAYDRARPVTGIPQMMQMERTAESYAEPLCVTDRDVNTDSLYIEAYSAGLFDLDQMAVLYAKDVFTKRHPASITKIMTALVALRYGNLDDMVTVTRTALDVEYGSSVCDIQVGDRLSMKQLLYGMMIASGNDAAMMVAEHVGGSVSHFIDMMNQEALRIGATRTHFTNPHGLTDEDHYTCIYDIYLMFREALKEPVFMDMISKENFYAEYTDAEGSPTAITWESTNHYFTGDARAPSGVLVYGGKTGTTDEAGACLALLCRDLYGNPYLSVILHASEKELLYDEMNLLLSMI